MRKKCTFLLLLGLGMTTIVNAQTMKENLFNMVSRCYNAWKSIGTDVNEYGQEFEYGVIDYDIPNGYVWTSGSWPTPECGCEAKAAAFKDANGQYTYIKYEEFYCAADYGMSDSNRNILDIMPEGFGLKSFTDYHLEKPIDFSFLLKFIIPQVGTDMNVKLSVLPLGSVPNDVNGLTFKSTADIKNWSTLHCIKYIAKEVDNNTLLWAAEGKFDELSAEQQEKFQKIVSSYNSHNNGGEAVYSDVLLCIIDVKRIYDIYQSLNCVEMTLKWNKQTARFEIKSKGPKVPACSFKEFLTNVVEYAD
ncbi:MAG: hypothetical protein J5767_11275 [Paludibacteraceae bacterium]|nr:hypothetical protein [Paludibacteraceae bacterium]